jgi:MFS family permease
VLLAAMSDVAPTEAGLASGIVNTSFMMGGALGLAILASLAAAGTISLLAAGSSHIAALNGGYHLAFLIGALFAAVAAVLSATLLRFKMPSTPNQEESRNEVRVPEVPSSYV